MMQDGDPRVKKLMEAAWSLQTLTNKPGNRFPDAAKRAAYKVSSKVISVCQNCEYTEESDFLGRSVGYYKEIEDKRAELNAMEEGIKNDLATKCFRKTESGYAVGKRSQCESVPLIQDADDFGPLSSTFGSSEKPVLTAKEMAARCEEDPEVLWLGNVGMTDSDVATLCDCLKKKGGDMTSIDLSHNQLADAGIQKLVSGLASGLCPKLEELWLNGNAFGELGENMLKSGLGALRKNLKVHTKAEDDSGGEARPSGVPREFAPPSPDMTKKAEVSRDEGRLPPKSQENETPVSKVEAPAQVQKAVAIDFQILDDKIKAKLEMPESVTSYEDFDLDLSADRLIVRLSAGEEIANSKLPCNVDPDTAKASFSKTKRTLTVTAVKTR
eukprot:TRINITY_DN2760_c0_g1_i2.p1 TRINITY_DN2760_c0_g1~~TRINITY_DN2760_c0_g1_i2.p1  ORF type:complete len:384 (-),score=100.37 TRINITY_DN2760_c0_g1_i2:227-1378(-)